MARSWLEWRLLRPDGTLYFPAFSEEKYARNHASTMIGWRVVRVRVTVHEKGKGKKK